MKKIIFFSLTICLLLTLTITARADEGMWLPQLLTKLNESSMKSLGMKLSAKDIYDVNNGSLKDAVVSLGGFCTAEIISKKGLLLTNHHCGFDAIQNHSSLTHNYIKDGFWAKSYNQELPNKGLFVTFIKRIDDVSTQVLAGVTPQMNEKERQSVIDKNITAIKANAKKTAVQDCFVRGFFEGNQYYLFVTETYKDVRLVGAPPASIGNFGKDTDNWMWPRHTGDFSLFRIYADSAGNPAEYSPNNKPYTPIRSLKVSLSGVAENDFTLIYGFPGRTNEYLPATAVNQIMTLNDPAKIYVRSQALFIIDSCMRKNDSIKIMYGAKYAGMQNAYKKWQGEVLGLQKTKAVQKKLNYEKLYTQNLAAKPMLATRYSTTLATLNSLYDSIAPYATARDYFSELVSKVELFAVFNALRSIQKAYSSGGTAAFDKKKTEALETMEQFYKEYSAVVDKRLFESMFQIYLTKMPAQSIAPMAKIVWENANQNVGVLADTVYSYTDFLSYEGFQKIIQTPETLQMALNQKAVALYASMLDTYNQIIQTYIAALQPEINKNQRNYMQAQLDVVTSKKFYPDANSTLRVAYGQVKGYNPRDAVYYLHYTTIDGLMAKYIPGDYEFDVPQKLVDLYNDKDYGRYGENGTLPVCFIAANHTTGGNSGSPALDAYGNLIGLNFDRVWEGTMSDINYDINICRNIMVNIKYVVFIMDKFANAQNLVNELEIVYPKASTKSKASIKK